MAGKVVGLTIGIDLGTTNSCVAVWKNDGIEIIPNDLGNRTTPSCVAFSGEEQLIGEAAVNQAAKNPTNTIFSQFSLTIFHLISTVIIITIISKHIKRYLRSIVSHRMIYIYIQGYRYRSIRNISADINQFLTAE